MRIHNIVKVLLLMLLMLTVCSCAFAEEWINPAYEYYYQQLTPNQQAMYRVILDAPAETGTYTIVLPEDGISREDISAELHTTLETIKMDHPESMAWLSWCPEIGYDAANNAVTFTLECSVFFDPEDQVKSEKLIDTIVAEADPSWDLYTKARFVSNVVIDALDYDGYSVFYSENGKADYYNSNIYCVNNGYAICGGFAKLFKAVSDRIGLPCVEVGSVAHAWVHVLMEDGNWYGVEPQDPLNLLGTSTMLNSSFIGDVDMYELYDGFFGEDSTIQQPERTTYDYEYMGVATDPGSVDLNQARKNNDVAETTLTYTVNEDGETCTITGFRGKESGDLVIPPVLDGYTVTAIGNSAFTYAGFDGTLTLPDTVEVIGAQAFAGCKQLKGQIVLPDNLVTIKSSAFIACSGFTGEIIFNDRLERIDRGAFGYCDGLTGSLMLPDSLISLEKDSFYQCGGLNGVLHIPTGITNWSASYVSMCENLTGFDVSPEHPSYCAEDGILYSRDMTKLIQCLSGKVGRVEIPEGVTVIGYQGLFNCKNITSLVFPSSLKVIEDYGCSELTGLTETITLPKTLEYIGKNAFQNCKMFPDPLVIPAGVQIGESAFLLCDNVTTVIVEEGVTKLPAHAFGLSSSIRAIYLPASIEAIDEYCFDLIYDLRVYGCPGTAAEAFVNSAEGQGLRAVFYPMRMADGYVLLGETHLSLLASDNNQTSQLSIAPYKPTDTVMWFSADESVATVDDGLVTGVSAGQTIISATFGTVTVECIVVVTDGISISADGKTLLKVSTGFSGELEITEGVEIIGEEAIFCVNELTGISFPSTLKSIKSGGLYGAGYSHDLSITFPESLAHIATGAIENNMFVYLQYPVNAEVEPQAIPGCHIDTLEIPQGVTMLPERVFSYSTIGNCYLPISLTSAPLNAFENATVETFYGYSGSYAETYVMELQKCYPEMGYTFVALPSEKLNGDADDNGVVDVYDALLVLQYSAGWDVAINVDNADYNANGTVSILDALRILEYCAGGDLTTALRALRAMSKELSINLLEIVEQPVDQYVAVGKQAQFTVAATGDGLEYQWYIDRNDGNGWCKLKDAAGETYITSAVEVENYGFKYRCVITDAYGNQLMSDVAVLHVVLELPVTGDASQPVLWMALCALSLMSFTLLMTFCKRTQRIC